MSGVSGRVKLSITDKEVHAPAGLLSEGAEVMRDWLASQA
jgi:hypothetical protein